MDPALAQLRHAFRDGDLDAFEALAGPHLDTVYALCVRVIGDAARGEDAAQAALVRAMERHHRYDPARAVRPWLLRIAVNVCRDRQRSPWWRRWSTEAPECVTHPALDESLGALQDAHRLHAMIRTLQPHYREALTLFHLDEMSYAEMSEALGVKEAALKQRVRRGRGLLAEKWRSMYPDDSEARSTE